MGMWATWGRRVLPGMGLVLCACVPVATGGTDPEPGMAGPTPPASARPTAGGEGTGVGAGPAGATRPGLVTPSAAASCGPTPGQEIVDAVNRIRRRAGLQPLEVDLRLVEAARSHTEDMARRNRLGHDGTDGREVQHRVEALGYDWLLIAENVASGQPTVADVMGSWMDSPGHRRNILAPDTRHMGAAARAGPGGRMYWTQVFGTTEVRDAPPGGCHP